MEKRLPLTKRCECGTLVWDGAVPKPTAWIECWQCGRDYSLALTPVYRLRHILHNFRYRLKRTQQAYGGLIPYLLKEFYWLPREWETRQGHHYWDGRQKPEGVILRNLGVEGELIRTTTTE